MAHRRRPRDRPLTRADSGALAVNKAPLLFSFGEAASIKVGPVTVLVISTVFVAVVILLHIWSKYMRA